MSSRRNRCIALLDWLLTVPGAQTAAEDTNKSITGLSFTDADANPASDAATMTLAVTHGTLTVLTNVPSGLTGGGVANNGTATVTLTGTHNAITTTLAAANGLVYLGAQDYNGPDTLTVTTNDQGHTGSDPGLSGNGTSEEDIDVVTF